MPAQAAVSFEQIVAVCGTDTDSILPRCNLSLLQELVDSVLAAILMLHWPEVIGSLDPMSP